MATNHLPLTELDKYSRGADELASRLEQLATFHEHRAGLAREALALQATRDRLNQSILDAEGPPETLAENLRGLETERLVLEASKAALAPRIDRSELALQNALAPAGARFGRLRDYMLAQALSRATGRFAALLEPAWRGRPEVLSLAEHELEYVQVASLALPSTGGWATARPLNEAPVAWNSLTRPYSAEELSTARAQTVDAIKTCASALVETGRKIIKECEAFGPEGVPEFDWTEPVQESKSVACPEWNLPLQGSDADFIAEELRRSGKSADSLSDQEKEILARMVEQRHKFVTPQPMFTGATEMLGSTTLE
jgi:hypothetical protein